MAREKYTECVELIEKRYQLDEFITVYLEEDREFQTKAILGFFASEEIIEKNLENTHWNEFPHSAVENHKISDYVYQDENGKYCNDYERQHYSESKEAIVYVRRFFGEDGYLEINQEFCHFHNLYHDKMDNKYYKINDNKERELIIEVIENKEVRIRLRQIKEYCAIKTKYLILQYLCEEKGVQCKEEIKQKTQDYIWEIYTSPQGNACFFKGKRLIKPLKLEYLCDNKFEDFIYKEEDDGHQLEFTCNSSKLNNNFGANAEAPHYLTPIHFKKDVLKKYIDNSDIYEVEHNRVSIKNYEWSLRLDNNHDNQVIVFLGDLAGIPYHEQKYWKGYNIPPKGNISKVFYEQNFEGSWKDKDREEFIFKSKYTELNKKTLNAIYKNIHLHDDYCTSIHLPIYNNTKEVDEFFGNLVKLLIEYLNNDTLNRLIKENDIKVEEKDGSIKKLERIFEHLKIQNFDEHISFLKDIQHYRSQAVAHRKNSDFDKLCEKLGLDKKSKIDACRDILKKANGYLQFLLDNGKIFS